LNNTIRQTGVIIVIIILKIFLLKIKIPGEPHVGDSPGIKQQLSLAKLKKRL